MDYDKPNEENNILNEPNVPAYSSSVGKRVRIFNSFREQEEEMIEYWASITPLQRLTHLYEMVKISFRISEDNACHTHLSGKIRIIKYVP